MVTEIASSGRKAIPKAFRELLLLEHAQKSVEGRSADQQARISELTEAVDARIAAAESLTAWDQVPPALVLLRDATLLATHAILESRGVKPPSTADATWTELASLVESGSLPTPPSGFERARALLSDGRYLALDELPKTDRLERRSEVQITLEWLRQQIDSRSVAQIKLSRVLRLGGISVAVAAGLGALVVWGAGKVLGGKNIALGAQVQTSSRRPDCPPGAGPAGAPPSALVDGSKSGAYETCTNFEVHPWVIVDLQKSHPLTKIKIYGRGDCCWGIYDLPAVLELSEDGTVYTEVGRRTTAFSASDPWTVSTGGRPARYVKIRSDSGEAREFVLNEIEVFASR